MRGTDPWLSEFAASEAVHFPGDRWRNASPREVAAVCEILSAPNRGLRVALLAARARFGTLIVLVSTPDDVIALE